MKPAISKPPNLKSFLGYKMRLVSRSFLTLPGLVVATPTTGMVSSPEKVVMHALAIYGRYCMSYGPVSLDTLQDTITFPAGVDKCRQVCKYSRSDLMDWRPMQSENKTKKKQIPENAHPLNKHVLLYAFEGRYSRIETWGPNSCMGMGQCGDSASTETSRGFGGQHKGPVKGLMGQAFLSQGNLRWGSTSKFKATLFIDQPNNKLVELTRPESETFPNNRDLEKK